MPNTNAIDPYKQLMHGVTAVGKLPLDVVSHACDAINAAGDLAQFPTTALPARLQKDVSGFDHVDARRIPLNTLLGKGNDTIWAVHATNANGVDWMGLYDSNLKMIAHGQKEDGATKFDFDWMVNVPKMHVVMGTRD